MYPLDTLTAIPIFAQDTNFVQATEFQEASLTRMITSLVLCYVWIAPAHSKRQLICPYAKQYEY